MKDLVELYSKKIEGSGLSKSYKKGNSFRFSGVPDSAHSFVACSLYKALPGETVIVVAPDNTIAEFLYRESLSFVDSKDTIYFPGYEAIPYDYARYPPDSKTERIRALSKILSGETFLIFTSVSGLIRKVPHPSTLSGKSLSVKAGEEFPQGDFLKSLSGLGYERSEVCEKFGEFSVKGGIVDVFTSFSEVPIRFDFFGDILEEIKTFDPLTQKSVESLNEAVILPADEFFLTENEKDAYHGKLKEFPESLARPDEELILEELTSLVHKQTGFFSYWKKPPVIVSSSHNAVTDKVLQIEREYESLFAKRSQEIICIPPDELLSRSAEYESLVNKKCVLLTLLPSHEPKESELNLALKETNAFKGKIREVREKILELNSNQGSKMIITASFSQQMERLSGLFQDSEIRIVRAKEDAIQPFEVLKDKISLILALSELRNGFILSEENVTIWSENDIFGRAYKRKTKFKKHASRAIESFIDLKEGDHVVHINHGVGKFLKIEKTSAGGKVRDFLKLEYANGDTLFVPLDQISLVQRYVGGGDRPHLDSLGKNSWKKKKERVQESVDKLAEELILLYSSRMKLQGFAYPPDTIWQDEFEAEFEYEETPDQLAAIEAVKSDLESTRPMDRLVCGDVGYGKTEVAIRASFKVIMAGKQVMMVAPTTILSLQHFNTFQSRFKNYPVKVEMVSRFRSNTEVKDILSEFSKGKIDMIIGTHALMSPNVRPKNLGLLIIDEEQRFGVNHKEAIKKIKSLVDVLTLTATPIPRTLHMSLAGIRDLSIIETPPKNRQSVETYVLEENDDILQTAIQNELDRDGQVFYIHNRVETIENEAKNLGRLLPRISIGVLHGQLTEDEVEETLMDFYNKKYDILVTTTIIESGIDMPNVNTMIVKRADTFGLSQLYQIRGRVGRSGRKAYAYLFYSPDRSLTEQAEKRLNTIHEYQELGSGFKVAMRDLEIRGAGNLLGKEQSGDIMEVGFDLYVHMLEEAVSKLKGDEVKVEIRTAINLSSDFYIPEDYIKDTKQKIEFYKRFEGATELDEIDEIFMEMEDRFGEAPDKAKTFVILEKIRTLGSGLGFETVSEDNGEIKFKSGNYFRGDANKIIKLIGSASGLYINPAEPNVLRFVIKSNKERERLNEIMSLLFRIQPDSQKKNGL